MALKGKPPLEVQKRGKLFCFGDASAGKTYALCQFPNSYYIDCEHGAENKQYREFLIAGKSAYMFSNDLDEIVEQVLDLSRTRHPYHTLIIDPITVPYLLDCDAEAIRLQKKDGKDGTEFGRNKIVPDRKLRRLFGLLYRIDMNVVISSHLKNKWEGGSVTGTTYDVDQKMKYIFDVMVEVIKRGKDKRVGLVRKTREPGFPDESEFPWEYNEIVTRYGRQIFEREAIPIVPIPESMVKEIRELLEARKDGDDLLEKVLKKAGIDVLEDATQEFGERFIEALTKTGGKNVAVS